MFAVDALQWACASEQPVVRGTFAADVVVMRLVRVPTERADNGTLAY
jgi:hypothetical protein